MRIHSLSWVLSAPLILIAVAIAYFSLGDGYYVSVYVVVPIILLVVLYVLHPQIDYWYNERNPIPIDDKIREWLYQYYPYYVHLSTENKIKFENRLNLYIKAREIESIGKEMHETPRDIMAITSVEAIKLMMGLDDYLIGDFDRIYIYKHPFPSPRYQFLHTAECHEEDGVFIFSVEHLIPGIINPSNFYNIGMHTFAQAFIHLHPRHFTDTSYLSWDQQEHISGLTQAFIHKTMGFEKVSLLAVYINHFFTFPEKFKEVVPEIYANFSQIFNQNP